MTNQLSADYNCSNCSKKHIFLTQNPQKSQKPAGGLFRVASRFL